MAKAVTDNCSKILEKKLRFLEIKNHAEICQVYTHPLVNEWFFKQYFLGRIVRDLDDIEDLKNWVRENPGRIQQKKEDRIKRLERTLIEPKHMMDSSNHREHISNINEAQSSAFDAFRKRKNVEDGTW